MGDLGNPKGRAQLLLDLSIGPFEPYEPDSMDIPAENKAWDLNLITDQTYEPHKDGDEWWLPYTYEEQLEYLDRNRVPVGSDIIKDSQDLPIDFTGSR
jgi:hypothetical protein